MFAWTRNRRWSGSGWRARIAYVGLTPLDVLEIERARQAALWVRCGFPEIFLAATDGLSLIWRRDAVRGQLEDVPHGSKDPLFPIGFGLTYSGAGK